MGKGMVVEGLGRVLSERLSSGARLQVGRLTVTLGSYLLFASISFSIIIVSFSWMFIRIH